MLLLSPFHCSFLPPPCPLAVVLADGATIVANPISNPFSAAPAATTVVQTHSQSVSTNAPAQGSSPRPSILRKKPATDGWVDPEVSGDASSSGCHRYKQALIQCCSKLDFCQNNLPTRLFSRALLSSDCKMVRIQDSVGCQFVNICCILITLRVLSGSESLMLEPLVVLHFSGLSS